ncbi:MAG: fructose-1,6-bisphosphatase [Prevotella sp.]|nr:fructose-1,6-bisphosphatase [Prevotella sp.]
MIDDNTDMHYLQLLSHSFPTIAAASTEIINLEAIMQLPKGTEHFLADLHGESEAFRHVLKNASGNIKRKVNELFGNTIREQEKKELCTLIYYPEEKLELVKASEEDMADWYHITIHHLVAVCREVSSKYSRSKVRKALPSEFGYIIEELLHERPDDQNKTAYVNVIVDTIVSTGRADDFICAVCNVIQRLSIDSLHILGDIYDRGPGAHVILDTLRHYHSWDIQWGNHDVLWMGASAGNDACICSVLRLSLRYANLTTLEEGYGINLVPLATFAMERYADDPCDGFWPILLRGQEMDEKTQRLTAQMHKAVTVLQFKQEAKLIARNASWQMEDRLFLDKIDYERSTCRIDGIDFEMSSCCFPTVNPADPFALTAEEEELMARLHHSFVVCEKLRKHIKSLLAHGCMYAIYNQNLLFHASCPLNADGSLKAVRIYGREYSGRALMEKTGQLIRAAFQSDTEPEYRRYALDYFYYLWCGPDSPLFDKSKMATFERYFLKDKETYKERKGNYFLLRDSAEVCARILDAFGVGGANRHIINGHVPVHASRGENPIKAGGLLMVIDGGFSEAYHNETGIAGYTLVYHSRGFQLVQHEPFTSAEDAVRRGIDIKSTTQIVEMSAQRMLVADTDKGAELRTQVDDLRRLLYAYRHGLIKEHAPA